MDKKDKKKLVNKEGKDMTPALADKTITIQEMLDKISADTETLTGKDGMIELDPNNPFHKEWYEEDNYKGK